MRLHRSDSRHSWRGCYRQWPCHVGFAIMSLGHREMRSAEDQSAEATPPPPRVHPRSVHAARMVDRWWRLALSGATSRARHESVPDRAASAHRSEGSCGNALSRTFAAGHRRERNCATERRRAAVSVSPKSRVRHVELRVLVADASLRDWRQGRVRAGGAPGTRTSDSDAVSAVGRVCFAVGADCREQRGFPAPHRFTAGHAVVGAVAGAVCPDALALPGAGS
jgi:hypothetical protein